MDRTDYKYNLEYRATMRAEMLALASGLVAGDLSVIAAARKLRGFWDGVEPDIGTQLLVFVGIDSETDALPVGSERAHWNAEALARKDVEIRAAEQRWREKGVAAATQLIHLLEQSS